MLRNSGLLIFLSFFLFASSKIILNDLNCTCHSNAKKQDTYCGYSLNKPNCFNHGHYFCKNGPNAPAKQTYVCPNGPCIYDKDGIPGCKESSGYKDGNVYKSKAITL